MHGDIWLITRSMGTRRVKQNCGKRVDACIVIFNVCVCVCVCVCGCVCGIQLVFFPVLTLGTLWTNLHGNASGKNTNFCFLFTLVFVVSPR